MGRSPAVVAGALALLVSVALLAVVFMQGAGSRSAVLLNGDAGARLLQIPRASMLRQRRVLPGKLVLPRRTTALDEWGVPWAAPVVQGYSGERFLGMPYIEDSASRDVLETVNEERRSSENRYGYIKTYGQNVNWMHGRDLDPSFYNYEDWSENAAYDNTAGAYADMLGY